MKVVCQRAELVEALSNVSRAAAQKSPLKVIEGVLLRAEEGRLYMCCYDLELGISKSIPAQVSQTGEVVISLHLCDYARRMSGSSITIECDEKYAVHISSDFASYDIIGIPAMDFPELPTVDMEHAISISESKLRSLITQTSYAISTKPNMPMQYTGELFELVQGTLTLVALDGFRVALRSESVDNGESYSFIVPGKTINELVKLLSDTDENVEMTVAQKNIIFSVDGYSLISRLMGGTFMNYRSAMSDAGNKTVTVKTSDFISALDRMSLIITEADKSPVCCLFKRDSISFLCETELSRAVDSVSCTSDIEDEIEIGFNNRYLLDAFRAADTDEIRMLLHEDAKKPIQMLPPGDESFHFLLMPVLLRSGVFKKDSAAARSTAVQYDGGGTEDYGSEEDEADFGTDRDE